MEVKLKHNHYEILNEISMSHGLSRASETPRELFELMKENTIINHHKYDEIIELITRRPELKDKIYFSNSWCLVAYYENGVINDFYSEDLFNMSRPRNTRINESIIMMTQKRYIPTILELIDFNEMKLEDTIEFLTMARKQSEYMFDEIDKISLPYYDKWIKRNEKSLEEIVIYRGEASKSSSYKNALSWTKNKNVASFFANRFDSNGKIYQGIVRVSDIYYDYECSEEEVLVNSKYIRDIKVIE
mgnify:FL=1